MDEIMYIAPQIKILITFFGFMFLLLPTDDPTLVIYIGIPFTLIGAYFISQLLAGGICVICSSIIERGR